MAINYSVTQRTNPKDPMAEPKWYANAQAKNRLTMDALCRLVEKATTLSSGEVRAVLTDAISFITEALEAGDTVEFGDLGSFGIALSSTGATTEEDFDASYIKKARVTFFPGRAFQQMCKRLQYEKAPVRPHV